MVELPIANTSEPASSQRNVDDRGRCRLRGAGGGRRRRPLPHLSPDHDHAQHAGDEGDREDPAHRQAELYEQQGDQRAGHRAESVHGTVQAEGDAAVAVGYAGREQGVARRRAHALAHAVDEARRERRLPYEREREQQLAERRRAVAAEHEDAPLARLVGPAAERVAREAGGRLGDSLDDPQNGRGGAQHPGHEQGEERIDDLGAQVGDETDQAERPHVRVESAEACTKWSRRAGAILAGQAVLRCRFVARDRSFRACAARCDATTALSGRRRASAPFRVCYTRRACAPVATSPWSSCWSPS